MTATADETVAKAAHAEAVALAAQAGDHAIDRAADESQTAAIPET